MLKRISSFFLMLLFSALSVISVNAASYDESENVINVKAEESTDISAELQSALDYASKKASDSSPCKVVIPKGNYYLGRGVSIYSNTILSAYGANIIKYYNGGSMLRSGNSGDVLYGYSGYKNITLEGGTWDGNCFDSRFNGSGFSNLRFGHMSNLTIKDVSVKNNKNGHHIEIGGVNGIQIYGCYFSGCTGESTGGQEAVQLDVIHDSATFVGYERFDDSPCENVYIHNNTFKNVYRGVGSHNAVMEKCYKNINIYDNSFVNTINYAVYGYNWVDSKVYNNNMNNVGAGIDMRSMSAKSPSDNTADNSNVEITNNTIKIDNNSSASTVIGIRAWTDTSGNNTVSEDIPLEKRTIKNVSIANNKISGRTRFGICLSDAYKCSVSGNTVDGSDNDDTITSSRALYMSRSSKNTINNNTFKNILNSESGGIQVEKGSSNNLLSGNNISNVEKAGISINGSSNGADNNTVTGGKIENCNNQGIVIANGANGNMISDVSISKTGGNSITVNTADNCTVNNLKIVSGKANGINVTSSIGTYVCSNSVEDCSSAGININTNSSLAKLSDNRVISCSAGNAVAVSSDSYAPVSSLAKVTVNSDSVNSGSISGKTKANTNVEVYNGSSLLGSAKSNNNGEFTVKFTAPQSSASLLALIKDAGNNSSCAGFKYDKNSFALSTPKISGFENTVDGIKINWNKLSGAYKYRVYYKGSKGWTRLAETTGTSVTDKAVNSGKTYTYTVRCVDRNGKYSSDYDHSGWKQTWVAAPKITKLENTNSGVKITWSKSDGAYKYRVYYKTKKGWVRFAETTETSAVDTVVSSGKTYTYTVRCLDKNDKFVSGYNANGWKQTWIAAPKITKLENTKNGIRISWNQVPGAYMYRVYYKNSSGKWVGFKNNIYGTTKLDTAVKKGRTETYTIRCVDKYGNLVSDYNHSGWSITYR